MYNKGNETVATETVATPEIHTLLTREVHPICNWHEWLARWQATQDVQTLDSLLHNGFGISLGRGQYGEKGYDRTDRLVFYLNTADGWADHYLLQPADGEDKMYETGHDQHGNIVRKSQSKLRQQLALKAFDMLCLNFFRMELRDNMGRDEFLADWGKLVVSERLFPAIQDFFRVEQERPGDDFTVRNLSFRDENRSHNEQQAVTFIANLATFMWEWEEPDTTHWLDKEKNDGLIAAMRTRIDGAKPWMTEVLAMLGRLDILRKWILELDRPCWEKVNEIALRAKLSSFKHPVLEDRTVANLAEACYVGSPSAWFLQEHGLKTREHKRLETIREAKLNLQEAERKIKQLSAR